ncbi:MAG: MATE family efflux transporter [Lachnospiraceae bacterium]|jgi:putative MATE family efflux protein
MKERKHSNQIDMLHGSLWSKIMLFALPLAASSILQQLFNSADIAVVGRFAGSQALAAVGGNTPVINLQINLFVGLSVGVNVVIASYIGQNKKDEVHEVVHTAMLTAIVSGLFLMLMGGIVAPPILRIMNTPDDVIQLAVLYLRIYFLGMPFIMVYNFGSAILRSVGDTRRPLYCLLISGLINVALNLFLVIVFHLGVAGVAIATVTANGVSAGMILYFLLHEEDMIRLDFRRLALYKKHFARILRIGLPAGIQSMVFSLSNICIQTGVNSFGSNAVAGSASAVNFEFFTYFVTNAFAQAMVTFTSQNYGADQYDRCKRVFRLSLISGMAITGLMSMSFVLGRELFIRFYTVDPAVITYGIARMLNVAAFTSLVVTYEVSGAGLRGMDHSLLPAVLTIIGSCGFRIFWIYTVFRMYHSYEVLMIVYPVSWVLTGIMVMTAYFLIRKKEFKKREMAL